MALKNTQKPVTMSIYKLQMDKILKLCEHKTVEECMMIMLNEASKYRIVDATITMKRAKRSKK